MSSFANGLHRLYLFTFTHICWYIYIYIHVCEIFNFIIFLEDARTHTAKGIAPDLKEFIYILILLKIKRKWLKQIPLPLFTGYLSVIACLLFPR